MAEAFVDIALFTLLIVTALAIVRLRNLFAVVMLSSAFSLLSAGLFVTLDAVDVAFTEAAVGAGISTALMLGTIALTARTEKPMSHGALLPLFVVLVVGAALVYGTLDLPPFGSAAGPIHHHIAPDYIARMPAEIGVPNFVTGILASYRGFDTLGETAVIFTAGIAVVMLLHRATRPAPRRTSDDKDRSDA
jgi:multicomponent Na+:H+ antiporter subunit B